MPGSGLLSERERDRIYVRRIRPDLLDATQRSDEPTAVLVGGQPGAGTLQAAQRVQTHLARTLGAFVRASGEELREYHFAWRSGSNDQDNHAKLRADVGHWYFRLFSDALDARSNLVLTSSMRDARAIHDLTSRLRQGGYQVAAVVLAVERDQSRQATLAGFDLERASGLDSFSVLASQHDAAYTQLRDALDRLERNRLVDRLQVVSADGRQLYANQLNGAEWMREPRALAALDDYRERKLTAREQADSVLRWRALAQRFSADGSVPRDIAALAAAWSREALDVAAHDPEAARFVRWGQEAEAFRVLSRATFLHEFPQLGKAVERMDEAVRFAEQSFALTEDRERFVAQSKVRIAERIAEGRFEAPAKVKEREPRAR